MGGLNLAREFGVHAWMQRNNLEENPKIHDFVAVHAGGSAVTVFIQNCKRNNNSKIFKKCIQDGGK